MPRSKRDKKITLTKVKKRGRDGRTELIDKVRAGQRHALVDLYQPPNVFQTGSHRFFVAPDRPRDHGGGAFTGRRVGSTWVDARST